MPAPSRPRIVHTFALTKFYDTADPLPAAQPGELIRSAEFDDYDLPGDVSAVRILYHSQSASGDDVPVSGVVLFPGKKAPAGGWPIIAWAHDLNGVARSCAPSLGRNLRQGSFLSMYVQLGYAVVATDYAGLGTSVRNAYADMSSNASDVIYSVAAARKAVPQLGSRWIAMGTGEGAIAVIAAGELEQGMRDPNYLGSITLSHLADLREAYKSAVQASPESLLFLAYGVQTVFPKFDVNQILTARAMPLYRQIGVECKLSDSSPTPSTAEIMKPKWESNRFVQAFFDRNRAGLKPAAGFLLVISSQGDPRIMETEKTVSRMCGQGDRVEFEKYPSADPGTLMGDSVREQIGWIQEVFGNKAVQTNCSGQR